MATLAIGGHTGEPLEARLYPKVVAENNRHWIPDTAGAALVLHGERPELAGRFAVWEVEIAADKKTVTKLAFDAILYLDKQELPVLVSVRFNSKYK